MNRTILQTPKALSVESHADMHFDHRRWNGDHAMWRDDVTNWLKEIEWTKEQLSLCDAALKKHSETMNDHLRAIVADEAAHDAHERSLVDFEHGGSDMKLLPMARLHQKRATVHERRRRAHERLKRYHHVLVAHATAYLKAIREAEL
jgi:hypothetical protein